MEFFIRVMSAKFQQSVTAAAKKLADAFEAWKATKKAKKDIENRLEQILEEDPDYLNLLQEEKTMKKAKRDLAEKLADIKDQKELMRKHLEQYAELEEFVEKTEGVFLEKRDQTLSDLAKDLAEQGIEAELLFKNNGDLVMVVSRTSSAV